MERKKRKLKKNHVIIVTSDAVDAKMSEFRIRTWLFQLIIIIFCVLIGAIIGYLYYEKDTQELTVETNDFQEDIIAQLEEQKKALEAEVVELTNKITILSETVNQKTQSENELNERLEKQSTPTEFPLTGSASMEEITEGDPICIFTAAVGVTVVATASGTVTAITDDIEYGHNVWIDHGNGYVTIYRNQGEVNVKTGDNVAWGTTIFLIGEENARFGYQMMKDGTYINPMDMLTISG